MTKTTSVTLPTATVDVLTAPLTRVEYDAAPDVHDYVITRVVSLDWHRLVNADSWQEMLARAVIGELGGDWDLHEYRVVGADPRFHGSPDEGCRVLVRVGVDPGFPV